VCVYIYIYIYIYAPYGLLYRGETRRMQIRKQFFSAEIMVEETCKKLHTSRDKCQVSSFVCLVG
jgi:hypothetical protein